MKRRRITDEDTTAFIEMLRNWDIEKEGDLSWNSFIKKIQSVTGYLYERTSLYKTKSGTIHKEFEIAKDVIKSGPKTKGETMSRQSLLVAYTNLRQEADKLRSQNLSLLQLHTEYLKILYENDITPDLS
ncbi:MULTISPECIES: hypothetical protein [unclassified Pseudomonas]|uniref:hypothetical protein n=1 Tax=unclassified Pseudomonas TaxID=196821 RepID=UPI0015874D76|nr:MULTISPECIES: hypothetical protein [unclassified Pseudomonas]QKV63966.1 hypothetical protein HUW52_14100 [Pseudomonas sp. 43A]QMW07892.1 hypothetical protein H3303_18600 [Pseudomonas sp. 29A]